MRFSAAILALAASASAAVLPRANGGSWKFSVTELEDKRFYTTAVLTTEAYPEGLKSSCALDTRQTPVFNRCDRAAFSADWDGKTLKLSQVLDQPTAQTVFGEADLTLEYDAYHKQYRAEGTIEVQKAIA